MRGRWFSIAAFVLVAAACSHELDVRESGRTVLTVRIPDETKTVLGDAEDGVRSVLWCKGDRIKVNGVESSPLDVEENTNAADFVFDSDIVAPYSIIYPSAMAKGENTMTLPSSQNMAKGDNVVSGTLPMVGYSTDEDIRMKQVCGILGIRLKAGDDTGLIRYIEVSAPGEEPLSGDFTVDFQNSTLTPAGNGGNTIRMEVQSSLSSETADVFNVILPAGKYSDGFSIKVVDENGKAMKRSLGGERELVAGKLMLLPVLTFSPNTEDKGIEIATPEDWNSFATKYNAGEYPDSQIATIVSDLDFSSVSADDFVTLGIRDGSKQFPKDGSVKYFEGTLNGGGHKILNLNADVPFIQAIGAGALVQDLNIDESCTFTPWYGGEKQLEFGSLVGYCSDGKVKNCANAAKVTVSQCNSVANKQPFYVGGLIGRNRAATISGCSNSGLIVADATYVTDAASKTNLFIGGFVGYCSNSDGVLENCSNTCDISVASTALNIYVGGICAKASAGTMSGCTNSGSITVSTVRADGDPCKFLYLGGLFGVVDTGEDAALKVSGCSNSGDITSASNVKQLIVGGIAAQLGTANAEFDNNTNSGNIKTTAALRNLYCGGVFGRVTKAQTLTFNGEPCTGSINIGATESSATATFLYCGGLIGQTSAEVVINGDATLKSAIAYDISSAKNAAAESFFGGIVGCAYGARIDISGMKVSGDVQIATTSKAMQHKLCGVGGIIGGATAGATISDCSNEAYLHMTANTSDTPGYNIHIGGIAGRLYGGGVEIKHCFNSERQEERLYNQNPWTGYDANAVGGIVGSIGYLKGNTYSAVIEDCHNTGSVYAYCGVAGGIAGYVSKGTITDCTYIPSAKGITRSAPGGGIVGIVEECNVSSCDSKANIEVNRGGTTATADAGGIIGEAVSSSVDGCRYSGNITQAKTSNTAVFGGIIGKADDASSAGVTKDCGFGGTINGVTIAADNVSNYAIGSTTGTRGTFYLWNGTL